MTQSENICPKMLVTCWKCGKRHEILNHDLRKKIEVNCECGQHIWQASWMTEVPFGRELVELSEKA